MEKVILQATKWVKQILNIYILYLNNVANSFSLPFQHRYWVCNSIFKGTLRRKKREERSSNASSNAINTPTANPINPLMASATTLSLLSNLSDEALFVSDEDGKEDVPLEGYLMKKSPGKLQGWQRRWFSLKGYNLFYYSGKTDNSLFHPFAIERSTSTW